jgi:hypothetical protein
VLGIRLVVDALWNHEHFASRHVDGAIPKVDPQCAFQNNERLICILVTVPNEIAL